MGDVQWVKRWGMWLAPTPVRRGVYRHRDGGFFVRARYQDRLTHSLTSIAMRVHCADADEAYWQLYSAKKQAQPTQKPLRAEPRHVYFIFDEASKAIKIGTCTGSPVARLKTLQTGHPGELRLLAYMPGGRALEAELHRQFSGVRLRGEWFKSAGPFREWIRNNWARLSVPETTRAWARADG